MADTPPRPTDIRLHQKARELEITFDNGAHFRLPCEYLRVYSPSAEVRGHTPAQAKLPLGKENVNITDIRPVGNYAIQLMFDDGHNTGLYTWKWLYELGEHQEAYWQDYLTRLEAARYQRKPRTDTP